MIYEALLKVGDNTSPNPAVDAACYKHYDIICAMPEGHPWTPEERPRVVKIDAAEATVMGLLAVERDESKGFTRRRTHRLKLTIKPSADSIKKVFIKDFIEK